MILKATLPLLFPLSSVAESPTRIRRLRLPRVSPETRLRRAALRGGPVTLGTPAAPYEPDGCSPLTALEGIEGLEISVVTRSPKIVNEIDLLADLDRRCSVTVDLLAPAAGKGLEPVARLAAEGIAVRVLCPLTAGGDEGEPALRKLLAAAREAGACDVRPLPSSGNRLLSHLRPKPGTGGATFRRLRLEYGFPRQMPGRG